MIENVIKIIPYQNYPKNKTRCFIYFIFSDVQAIAIGKKYTEVVKITLEIYVFT